MTTPENPWPWKRVIFAFECDDEGNCPVCGIQYGDCGCPEEQMNDHEYTEIDGEMHARPIPPNLPRCEGTEW